MHLAQEVLSLSPDLVRVGAESAVEMRGEKFLVVVGEEHLVNVDGESLRVECLIGGGIGQVLPAFLQVLGGVYDPLSASLMVRALSALR